MTTYRTIVTELPATPLGLLPAQWIVEHHCTTCHRRVTVDELLAHTEHHRRTTIHDDEGGTID